jgi:hypothetical protein
MNKKDPDDLKFLELMKYLPGLIWANIKDSFDYAIYRISLRLKKSTLNRR